MGLKLGLEGKTVLVTGAGRGLGAGCVGGFVDAGAHVIAVARSAEDLAKLRTQHEHVETWQEDVTSAAFLERMRALPQLDVLVNNAGGNKPEPMQDVAVETLDQLLDLNVRAVYLASQAAISVMLRQGSGAIVNMSSQMGHVGSPGRTVYCMTKHAVEGLTKAMAVELAPQNIRVNSVGPTFVETPLTKPMLDDPEFRSFVDRSIPLGRLGRLEDVVSAVVFLASDASHSTTGHSLLVDGGWTAQ